MQKAERTWRDPRIRTQQGGIHADDIRFDETRGWLGAATKAELLHGELTGGAVREGHAREQQRDVSGTQRREPGGEGLLLLSTEYEVGVEDDGGEIVMVGQEIGAAGEMEVERAAEPFKRLTQQA